MQLQEGQEGSEQQDGTWYSQVWATPPHAGYAELHSSPLPLTDQTASARASNESVSEPDYWCGRQKERKGEQSSYGPQSSSQRPGEMGMPIW